MLDGSRKLPYVNTNVTPFPTVCIKPELKTVSSGVPSSPPDEFLSIHDSIVLSGSRLCHRVVRGQTAPDTPFDIPATAS